MTTTARLTALASLPFIAAWALIASLFCPIIIAAAASIIFTPDSDFYGLLKIACFLWGAWEVLKWWEGCRTTVKLIHSPGSRKARRPRRRAAHR